MTLTPDRLLLVLALGCCAAIVAELASPRALAAVALVLILAVLLERAPS